VLALTWTGIKTVSLSQTSVHKRKDQRIEGISRLASSWIWHPVACIIQGDSLWNRPGILNG
jgi:hypothetical protein